jgi:hypothetical protein
VTTRTEAAGYAEAWATRADQHATDYRDVSYAAFLTDPSRAGYHAALRVQADAMALLWARVGELQPDIDLEEAEANRFAQLELDTLREGLRNIGVDPTNVQNLQAQLTSRTRQWRDATAELEQLRAGLTAIGEIAAVDGEADNDWKCGYAAAANELRSVFARHNLPLPTTP